MIFLDETISDYTTRDCGIDFAGVVGIGLINIYQDPDPEDLSDPDFWLGKLEQSPRKYFVIRNTRGEYANPDLITEEDLVGYLVTGANHSAVIDAPGIKENREFWNEVKNHNWKLCIVTAGGLLYYIDKPVSFYPKIVNPKSIKSDSFFQVQMKWMDLSNPFIVDAPEGIFTGIMPEIDPGDGVFDYTFDETFG